MSSKARDHHGKGKSDSKSSKSEKGSPNTGFALFAVDVVLIVIAVVLFASKPTCTPEAGVSNDGENTDYGTSLRSDYIYQQNSNQFSGHVPQNLNQNFYTGQTMGSSGGYSINRPQGQQHGGTAYGGGGNPTQVTLIPEDGQLDANAACGNPATKPDLGRIVGGSEAAPHSWPWAGSLGYPIKESPTGKAIHLCGVTLLSSRHALTAAHCFASDPKLSKKYAVYLTHLEIKTFAGAWQLQVIKIRPHPLTTALSYGAYPEYDFALLTLDPGVPNSPEAMPVCLPKVHNVLPGGTNCWVQGFGATLGTGGDTKLKQLKVDMLSESRCMDYRSQNRKELVVCGGTMFGQDTCSGDSGGPLTCQIEGTWRVYGVMSYGPNDCGKGVPAAYASVAFHVPWLCCYMANLPSCKGVKCNPSGNPATNVVPSTSHGYSPNQGSVYPPATQYPGGSQVYPQPGGYPSPPATLYPGGPQVQPQPSQYPGGPPATLYPGGPPSYPKPTEWPQIPGGFPGMGYTTTTAIPGMLSLGPPQPVPNFPYGDLVEMNKYDGITNSNFECGVSSVKPHLNINTRVIGGSVAIPHSWPWMVAIQSDRSQFCGGTVVSPRHVVSAAHCFNNYPTRDPTAAGQENPEIVAKLHVQYDRQGEVHKIVWIRRVPEGVHGEIYFDLVLLTVDPEIVFDQHVKPACLPVNGPPPTGKECWAYGWGSTRDDNWKGDLKQVMVEISTMEHCKRTFGRRGEGYYNPDVILCAGGREGHDTCQGDSGGPLTCFDDGKWVLYGATSFGDGCAEKDKVAVYAAVEGSVTWICCFMADIPGCRDTYCDPGVFNKK